MNNTMTKSGECAVVRVSKIASAFVELDPCADPSTEGSPAEGGGGELWVEAAVAELVPSDGAAPAAAEAEAGAGPAAVDGLVAPDEPRATFEPATETEPVWLAEATSETDGAAVAPASAGAAEEELVPPDAAGAATAPMGATAAEPNMRIITATASTVAPKEGFIYVAATLASALKATPAPSCDLLT